MQSELAQAPPPKTVHHRKLPLPKFSLLVIASRHNIGRIQFFKY
jgi:hypothetical protein